VKLSEGEFLTSIGGTVYDNIIYRNFSFGIIINQSVELMGNMAGIDARFRDNTNETVIKGGFNTSIVIAISNSDVILNGLTFASESTESELYLRLI
jgi:hypothetical protein